MSEMKAGMPMKSEMKGHLKTKMETMKAMQEKMADKMSDKGVKAQTQESKDEKANRRRMRTNTSEGGRSRCGNFGWSCFF